MKFKHEKGSSGYRDWIKFLRVFKFLRPRVSSAMYTILVILCAFKPQLLTEISYIFLENSRSS